MSVLFIQNWSVIFVNVDCKLVTLFQNGKVDNACRITACFVSCVLVYPSLIDIETRQNGKVNSNNFLYSIKNLR